MAMKMQPVPGLVVIVLCMFSFLMGRYVQQSALLPDAQDPRQLVSAPRRAVTEAVTLDNSIQEGHHSATTTTTPANIDPLDPSQLQSYVLESTGLMKLRPPLKPGESGNDFYHVIPFQILSWYPRIVVFPGFLDPGRCEAMVNMAKERLYPSGLAYRPGDDIPDSQETRTSSGTFLSSGADSTGVLAWVEERIAAATLLPRQQGEPFNVLRYRNGQHYDSHMDSFDPKEYGPQYSQRIATVLLYLSDVEEGGETIFKREGERNGERIIEDWRSCDDDSLKYKPRRGDAVLFWGVNSNLDIDPRSLHGGCPVIKGEKWVATKWIRNK